MDDPDVAAAVRAQTRFQRGVVIVVAIIIAVPLALAGYFRLIDSMAKDKDRKAAEAKEAECSRLHPGMKWWDLPSWEYQTSEQRAYTNCRLWGPE